MIEFTGNPIRIKVVKIDIKKDPRSWVGKSGLVGYLVSRPTSNLCFPMTFGFYKS